MARIRINRRPNFLYNLVVIILILGIAFLSYRLLTRYWAVWGSQEAKVESRKEGHSNDFFSEIWVRVTEIDFTDPKFIMSSQIPYLVAGMDGQGNKEAQEAFSEDAEGLTKQPTMDIVAREGVSRTTSEPHQETDGLGGQAGNQLDPSMEAEFANEIRIQVNGIEDNLPPISLEGKGPQILIYHTHSREAYRQSSNDPYHAIAAFRASNLDHTVVSVGAELAKHLREKGIQVIHDRTDHEKYNWESGLYPRSLETIQKRMEEFESLKIFLDIHRNYNPNLKNPDDEVVIIDGQRVAKFFILIGNGQGVSGGFKEKPKWQENYQFALKITNKANDKYPGLANPVMVKTGRYNQHISTKALLIEIGNHLTTLKEAKRTTKYLAEVISEIVEK